MFPPVFWLALFESSILVTDLSIRKERGAQGYFINIKNNYNFCFFYIPINVSTSCSELISNKV